MKNDTDYILSELVHFCANHVIDYRIYDALLYNFTVIERVSMQTGEPYVLLHYRERCGGVSPGFRKGLENGIERICLKFQIPFEKDFQVQVIGQGDFIFRLSNITVDALGPLFRLYS